MNSHVAARKWEAQIIKDNTALINTPAFKGQDVAELFQQMANLLENASRGWLNNKIIECGFKDTKVNVNLSTGQITPIDGPTSTPEAPQE